MITLKPYQIRKGNLLPRVATALLLMLSAATASSQAPVITIGGNIYGGGNKGNLKQTANVEILDGDILGNVFGGARRANVHETKVTVRGGKVRNVYGGNDISGTVEQQTYVDIRSNIINNVYGGGNGSYVYTDQEALKDDKAWEALYYAPGENSVEALNAIRPNVPRATIHLQGTSEASPTIIGGAVFCGGNSATLRPTTTGSGEDEGTRLIIGSHVIADKVFLGSNGADLVSPATLQRYADRSVSSIDLTDSNTFDRYMSAVDVEDYPSVEFDADDQSTPDDESYKPYSTRIGSFFCGGNVGSMTATGTIDIGFSNKLVIYDKLVGGCNNADVAASQHNAAHRGGITGTIPVSATNKLVINTGEIRLEPHTLSYDSSNNTYNYTWQTDSRGKLHGANIYGGCYESGHINGGVEINITADIISDKVFATEGGAGANYEELRGDPLVSTLSCYGGGYGEASEIWGDTKINITADGRLLKAYGGGEMGIIGRRAFGSEAAQDYNTIVTLEATSPASGTNVGHLYGGGYKGLVTGNALLNLNSGSVHNAFGGACNADINGYTEVFVGKITGPTVTGNVYGGNDFGGHILGTASHNVEGRIGATIPTTESLIPQSVRSNTYVEFFDGHIDGSIFGGPCGAYDYDSADYYEDAEKTRPYFTGKPTLTDVIDKGTAAHAANSFVNVLSPSTDANTFATNIFGGGQGMAGKTDCADLHNAYVLLHGANAEHRSAPLCNSLYGAGDCSLTNYSLVDAYRGNVDEIFGGCHGTTSFYSYAGESSAVNVYSPMDRDATDVYGAGAYSGSHNSTVNLYGGEVHNVYGASLNEGKTDVAQVNVPANSTVKVNALLGGGKGLEASKPCDVARTTVNYLSNNATVGSAIYGGNHNYRLTVHSTINIPVPVRNSEGALVDVYGGGYGEHTIAQATHVNLQEGAQVRNVYGGGRNGKVYNESTLSQLVPSPYNIIDETTLATDEHNTNVVIARGALVAVNAYAGGEGSEATVSGATGLQLDGGTVSGELYGGGYGGSVKSEDGLTTPVEASTNVVFTGGKVTNAFGGGLAGNVGTTDIDATTNITLGVRDAASDFFTTDPTVERSLYGGGERGAVYGRANLTINKAHVGYVYDTESSTYKENINLNSEGDKLLEENGNAFGGGYGQGATVDNTTVKVWGGIIRNSLYGGGEIAAVGRGTMKESGHANSVRVLEGIQKAGSTHIEMFSGHVLCDIFGGGRGYSYDLNGNELIDEQFYTSGYVFGRTEVFMRGGEVGTAENLSQGYGNVFGGGNIGYVYSEGVADTSTDTGSPNHYYYYKDGNLTEDCRVVLEPYAQVLSPVTIDGRTYNVNEYVPTDALNTLRNKYADNRWACVSDAGIIVHNAVFAGGNVAIGSDKVYANATTVFGNVTATLRDIYHRDLITIGTEHTGGLYGGGNLATVNGYRELHIANYGTDYYGLDQQITLEQYGNLSDREKAYFELKYECVKEGGVTIGGIKYEKSQTVSEEVYSTFDERYKTEEYWMKAGFCSIYAGRLLNCIQRADLAGVFGSRMVMQGARDRVTEVVDYNNYTINRVGEVSLNAMRSTAGDTDEKDAIHGNYFGIYSMVNRLGNLTSDVKFEEVRKSDTSDTDGTTTYYQWKKNNATNRKRNTATCHNMVALASGVFLELTTEHSTADHKDYGDITGVVELDLINVNAGIGGGYVYARNEHGVPTFYPSRPNVTLSEYNSTAVTYKSYEYSATSLENIQTSGNFIHGSKKRIIDDCYPYNGVYEDGYVESPAHYWFVKGDVYIYDQVISAYTGSATAYSREIKIPLTITAGSHGKLTLMNVQPNLYAYYSDYTRTAKMGPEGVKVNNETQTFHLNDVISYWDYRVLPDIEKQLFVRDTWINTKACTIDGTEYAAGEYVLENDGASSAYKAFIAQSHTITDGDGKPLTVDEVFHSSNNAGHETGYVLTFDMDTPPDWNNWYSTQTGTNGKITTGQYNSLTPKQKDDYIEGPSFRPTTSDVYGQRLYSEGEIIPRGVWYNYNSIADERRAALSDQAVVERAYVAKSQVTYTYDGTSKTVNTGTAIPESEYNTLPADKKALFGLALVCTSTLKLNENNYLLYDDLITSADVIDISNTYGISTDDINEHVAEAYICKTEGNYGGKWYDRNTNYTAIESWCSLSEADRRNFEFNYDALNLFIDSSYPGMDHTEVYDNMNPAGPYHVTKPVEYRATYNGDETLEYYDVNGNLNTSVTKGTTMSREDFEHTIPNEQHYYAPIKVEPIDDAAGEDYYIVKESFVRGATPYTPGQVIPKNTYDALSPEYKAQKIHVQHFPQNSEQVIYYYCREPYVVGEYGGYETGNDGAFTDFNGNTYSKGSSVAAGTLIPLDAYQRLPNNQHDFIIKGIEPTETSTLYVSRESEIYDLTKERIITAVYQYNYDESDDTGENIDMAHEVHVVNIHLKFESGVPTISPLTPPAIVLPGSTVGMKKPNITPGAYEILGGGWEIFADHNEADNHRNGQPWANNETKMYWYENNKHYIAYYARTYLGKTYSNAVPIRVANYHDLAEVMADTTYHLHVDYDPEKLERNCKVYINDYSADGKNGLDLLSDLVDLSYGQTLAGHNPLEPNIRGGENLDIILRSDQQHDGSWTPIASEPGRCFSGTLHGDGHTVSGLTASLFGKLCGSVYNLGATGSFTTAGIADSGSGIVENCWVKSSGTVSSDVQAVLGNPDSNTQIRNCYYPVTNGYSNGSAARAMALRDFSNGTVAYNLNGFYLKQRFDNNVTTGGGSASRRIGDTYVNTRYVDGDFIYADGIIPDHNDVRLTIDASDQRTYVPIFPDDYLFFGQSLTYGYRETTQPYQPLPAVIDKVADDYYRLPQTDRSNRVFRSPAYFRSKQMNMAHFNPGAILAAYSTGETGSLEAYKDMTAVDFTGYGDVFNATNGALKQYGKEWNGNLFYPPLLDDGGLLSLRNADLTRNLLVYAPQSTVAEGTPASQTRQTLVALATEPEYVETNADYRTVAVNQQTVTSHIVERTPATTPAYLSLCDQLLVDRQDFNAPIAYTFMPGTRMWYQRAPLYANQSKGWEGVSLPFEVELVTTQTKGELSHFYTGSTTGHEYWLRCYKDISAVTGQEEKAKAVFSFPDAVSGRYKDYTNTFLWDYYYSQEDRQDQNTDIYKTYYNQTHTYEGYPLQQAGTPYLAGFPGERYYEFDLSGRFVPQNTMSRIEQLGTQVITFASQTEEHIGVSDDNMHPLTHNGYTFVPSYMSTSLAAGTMAYALNSDGSSYDLMAATGDAVVVQPFRPYFTVAGNNARPAQSIIFSDETSQLNGRDEDDKKADTAEENMLVGVKAGKIVVTSHLRAATTVTITTTAGITTATFELQPEQSVETPVSIAGIYIVRDAEGRHTYKIAVRK